MLPQMSSIRILLTILNFLKYFDKNTNSYFMSLKMIHEYEEIQIKVHFAVFVADISFLKYENYRKLKL